ncbi:RHS repeat-associated core domain-containing protein, partial [Rhizobacter sp. Root29]|uniref:RHS repeat-associated core domain-containing protein n=2 Tax=Rhizobacter TaxID=212743 RepID=UPI00138F365F
PGQYADAESGLWYNYFRYYAPDGGAYRQSDPIGLAGASFSTYAYANNQPINMIDSSGLMGGGGNHAKPGVEYAPDRECMQFLMNQDLGWLSGIAKEFSVFSLYPNEYNVDDHWIESVALTGGGVGSKVAAYRYMSASTNMILQFGAKGLHLFGETASLPATALASLKNAAVADRCVCQERKNPGAWARAREERLARERWLLENSPVYPVGGATPIGF